MRAVHVVAEEGPDAVRLVEIPEPDGELVIAVRAAAVSFPDVLMTKGEYQLRQPLPFVLGWEAAGDVIKAPDGGRFAVGDRVMTLMFGAHAELIAPPVDTAYPIPEGLSYEQGAALPLNYLTAVAALERRGRLMPGERVLIHGAAGGVGTASIQIAKALGATVVASVSTDDKAEVARAAGADEVVVGEDFRAGLSGKVNLVIDPVGGTERLKDSLRSLHPEGRVVIVGFAGGEIPELRVNRLLLGNTDVVGCSFNVIGMGPDGLAGPMQRLAELANHGAVAPVIGPVHPIEDVITALHDIEDRRAAGTVIVTF